MDMVLPAVMKKRILVCVSILLKVGSHGGSVLCFLPDFEDSLSYLTKEDTIFTYFLAILHLDSLRKRTFS